MDASVAPSGPTNARASRYVKATISATARSPTTTAGPSPVPPGKAKEHRRERSVVVGEVGVRKLAVCDPRAGHQVVAGVPAEIAPRVPRERDQHDADRDEHDGRNRVGGQGDDADAKASLTEGQGAHATARSSRGVVRRSRTPATARSATPMTAWPFTTSG